MSCFISFSSPVTHRAWVTRTVDKQIFLFEWSTRHKIWGDRLGWNKRDYSKSTGVFTFIDFIILSVNLSLQNIALNQALHYLLLERKTDRNEGERAWLHTEIIMNSLQFHMVCWVSHLISCGVFDGFLDGVLLSAPEICSVTISLKKRQYSTYSNSTDMISQQNLIIFIMHYCFESSWCETDCVMKNISFVR